VTAAGDRPPTVLQVLPRLDSGGVERGTVEVARGLVAAGWRAVVAAEPGRLVEAIEAAGACYVDLPLASKNPVTLWQNAARLEALIDAEAVDLVHARSRAPAWSAHRAARRRRRPFVTTFHSIYSGYDEPLKHRYNRVMAMGDEVIAISDYVAEHLQAHYRVPAARIRTIPRPVDLAAFDPAATPAERGEALRRAWGLGAAGPIVLLAGRVTPRKGHLELLRALKRLGRPDVVCLFVGAAPPGETYRKQVELFAHGAGLSGQVVFAGHCDDMPAAYSLADVVAVPSVDTPEAFGRVSVEAQAMGKPVIVHAIGGLPETMMPGATGWLVDPGDTEGLADALALALAMPAEVRARTAERARRFVAEHFTMERFMSATLDVYRGLLEGVAR